MTVKLLRGKIAYKNTIAQSDHYEGMDQSTIGTAMNITSKQLSPS